MEDSRVPDPLRGWFEPPGQARQFLLTQSGEVFIGGKPHLLVSVHDATTQKSLDESLEHTDRLSLAGNMAAQLAHEIANPLALMSSQIQRMMESGEAGPGQLERLLNSLDRVASLVGDLSHLGRKTALQRELLDAGSLVREAVKLMEFDNRFRDLKVEVDITPDLPAATLDRDKIAQVLINLLLNAADAMPEGGTISISCRAVKPAVSWNGETFEGQYILLSVRDTGHGIAPNVMKRMWEPFYTTKPVGKGTGLGLAVSMSIVDQHRGYLETRSTPGKGSTFTVWLPVKRWPYCWEATRECTRETHFSCPVFRHQSCHRCWSDPEALCHDSGWSNPFLAKPDALIRET
jgi:two-component system sensor histidine kinase PilS (NtrC family)